MVLTGGGSDEEDEEGGGGSSIEDDEQEEEEDSEEEEDGGMLDEYEAEQMRMLKLLGQVVRKRLGEGHPETVYAHVSPGLGRGVA